MTSEWVYDLKGKEVVFTGNFDGYVKADLAKFARDLGARNVSGWVNQCFPAPALKPHSPNTLVRAAAEGGVVGAPYRPGAFAGPLQGDGEHYRDPDIMERGLKAHSATQDKLAELIGLHGLTPLSPFDKTCNFDLAWERADGSVGVAEVKSITEDNEAFQVRHGLGQVLDYGHRLTGRGFQPKLFLVLEAKPQDAVHWKPLCAEHGVILTWGPFFTGVF